MTVCMQGLTIFRSDILYQFIPYKITCINFTMDPSYVFTRAINHPVCYTSAVVSSGGAPTPAGTSVFTKHKWDMGMGYLWLNGWGIYHLMGGAFTA